VKERIEESAQGACNVNVCRTKWFSIAARVSQKAQMLRTRFTLSQFSRLACALVLLALPVALLPLSVARAVPLAAETVVYSNTFSSPVGGEWSMTRLGTTPLKTQTYGGFLGQFSKDTAAGDESVTLTLSDLAPATYHVTFDLLIIKSWDGIESFHNALADRWSVGLEGQTPLVLTSFSNNLNPQTYPDPFNPSQYNPSNPVLTARYTGLSHAAVTGAFEKNKLGFTFPGVGIQDAVYKMDLMIPVTDPSMVLRFSGLGLDSMADASWGLDNVVVARVPEPSTLILAVLGAFAIWGAARCAWRRRS